MSKGVAWTCPLCRVALLGKRERATHLVNLHMRADDPARCDNVLRRQPGPDFDAPDFDAATPILTPANYCTPLMELARRPANVTPAPPPTVYAWTEETPTGCRDFVATQDAWEKYVTDVGAICDPLFWKYFLKLHTLSRTAIDSALSAAKECFRVPLSKFPLSLRTLRDRIKRVPDFWTQVRHQKTIDISSFNLPVKSVSFRFIDPIWAWIVAARRIDPQEMHWVPDTLISPQTGERCYGAGVQYGEAFAAGAASCPPGTYPLFFSLHWDGATARGLSACPICLGVGNTNVMSPATQFCVGYVPVVTGLGKKFYSTPKATELKFFIRNACAAAILEVLETGAKYGIMCRLVNRHGVDTRRLLMPRMMSMNFDQPEGQLFFGHKNSQCCSKCLRRFGCSCFKKSKEATRRQVQLLYDFVDGADGDCRAFAQAKLQRWGFNPLRRCCLLSHSFVKLFIRVPRWPLEVFPCVDYRDRMHGLMNQMYVKLLGAIDDVSMSTGDRQVLDRRLAFITRQRMLRDPVTRRSYRRQQSLFSADGLTIVDKVSVLFILPHILGPAASILPVYARWPVLQAIARAQLCVIAARGRRSYTENELYAIFNEGYIVIFRHLETLFKVKHDKTYATKLQKHAENPDKHPKPKAFTRKRK